MEKAELSALEQSMRENLDSVVQEKKQTEIDLGSKLEEL